MLFSLTIKDKLEINKGWDGETCLFKLAHWLDAFMSGKGTIERVGFNIAAPIDLIKVE